MVQCMEFHIECIMYGDSYKGYKLWRLIERVQGLEPHEDGTMYVESYRGYNVWRLK